MRMIKLAALALPLSVLASVVWRWPRCWRVKVIRFACTSKPRRLRALARAFRWHRMR